MSKEIAAFERTTPAGASDPNVLRIEEAPNGVVVLFVNGWELSIRSGPMNYSGYGTFETAVFTPAGAFYRFEGHADDVQGWQTEDDIRDTVAFIVNR